MPTSKSFMDNYINWDTSNPGGFNMSGASQPISAGLQYSPGTNFLSNYGVNAGQQMPGVQSGATPTTGFNWGTAGNVMGAVQGGIGIYNNIMDILGRSDADKQRKFAKTFTMREWNTKARMHDNQLQMGRNKVAMWNAANPGATPLSTFSGLKSLGTWGKAKGRVLGDGTVAG